MFTSHDASSSPRTPSIETMSAFAAASLSAGIAAPAARKPAQVGDWRSQYFLSSCSRGATIAGEKKPKKTKKNPHASPPPPATGAAQRTNALFFTAVIMPGALPPQDLTL